jgi:hypothetical protein
MILRHKKRNKLQTFYSCRDTIKRRRSAQMLEWLKDLYINSLK